MCVARLNTQTNACRMSRFSHKGMHNYDILQAHYRGPTLGATVAIISQLNTINSFIKSKFNYNSHGDRITKRMAHVTKNL